MEWDRVVAAAKEWASKNSLGFSISGVEEGERKISFRAPNGSFYVTVPDKIGAEEWVKKTPKNSFLQFQTNPFCNVCMKKSYYSMVRGRG